jgi:hypothetical protein
MWGHRARDRTARTRANTTPVLMVVAVAASVGLAAIAASPGAARTMTRRTRLAPRITTSTPIALDVPSNGSDPLVAFDPVTSTTFVAWSNVQGAGSGVDLCVLPANTNSCEGGGPVLLSVSELENPAISGDNTISLGGLTVLPNGDVVVIGTPVANSSVAWESPGDGSAFLTSGQGLQNGGTFISPVSLFYAFNNAVALNNTDVALLDDYSDYFSDSPYAGPESPLFPNTEDNENSNQGNGGLYPRKSLETSGPEIAAMQAPPPAAAGTDIVVAVGDNFGGPNVTPSGCINRYSTGYAVSAGTVNGASKAAGTLNGEGIPGYGLLACSAESPVLASGGGAGIGVLEQEGNGISGAGSTWTVNYRPFTPTATGGSFNSGSAQLQDITAVSLDGAEDLDASEDSSKGVYASWVDKQGLVLEYSPNGGNTWNGANPQKELSNGATQGNPVIAGVGNGIGEVAYTANLGSGTQVFLQTVDFNPPTPTTLSSEQTSGLTSGANISITGGTVGETDRAAISGTNAGISGGSVTYNLYSSSNCKASSKVFGDVKTVTGGLAAASGPVTKSLAAGTYYWKDAYSGDVTNQASTSSCGSEKLTVAPVSVVGSGTTTGTTLTFTISCSAACTVTVTVELPAGSATRAGDKKSKKAIKLASGKFKLSKRGKDKLKLDWNKYAHGLVKKDHDKLTTTLLLTTTVSKHTFKTASKLKVRK